MKKSLVVTLALVFVFGIAGTALAANPFTDVPANHWAYAAVSKLAAEGIIEGYGDGRYFGNRTITRYEMAQIVAKAMANMDRAGGGSRAQIEKLAAEYADELDSLGVRVAKLEKNADNVTITGEVQFSHYAFDKKVAGNDSSPLRSRLWVSGNVNDNWKYVGMIEHDNNDLENNGNQGDFSLRRAWVEGNLGTVGVIAGRYNYIPMYGTVLDDDFEGLILSYNPGKFGVELFAGRPDSTDVYGIGGAQNYTVYGAALKYAVNDNFNIQGAYYKVDGSMVSDVDANIFEIGADYAFNDNFSMWAQYIRGDKPSDRALAALAAAGASPSSSIGKNGWAAGVQFGGADIAKPGTWQLTAAYYDVPSMGVIANTSELGVINNDGMKGWTVGASFVAAKNIDLNVEYFDYDSQGDFDTKTSDKLLWSYVRFYF